MCYKMITIESILFGITGLALGIFLTSSYLKFKALERKVTIMLNQLVVLDGKVISPEEMAKRVLSVKVPLNELPPDIYQEIKNQAETGQAPPKQTANTGYLG